MTSHDEKRSLPWLLEKKGDISIINIEIIGTFVILIAI